MFFWFEAYLKIIGSNANECAHFENRSDKLQHVDHSERMHKQV